MDVHLYPAFVDEATTHLADVRRALLFLAGTSDAASDLKEATDRIREIAESASILELTEISEIAESAAKSIEATSEAEPRDRTSLVNQSLDFVATLESLLLKASPDDENLALDIDDFIDQSFGLIEAGRPQSETKKVTSTPDLQEPVNEEPRPAAPDRFVVDDDLLEVFAEEAEQLLQNIENGIEKLIEDAGNSEALWEIRRNAHTFKGSAGIVGLRQLSEIAHKIEDLLDSISESDTKSSDTVLDLLRDAAQCLRDLVKGNKTSEIESRICSLSHRFAEAQNQLSKTAASVAEMHIGDSGAPTDECISPPKDRTNIIPAIRELFFDARPQQSQSTRPAEARSIVRISLSGLDEVVRIVREMLIGRSFYEQQLKDLERQVEELGNTTRRLQATSSKLEIDFETSMLSSDFPPASIGRDRSSFLNPTLSSDFDDLEFDRYTAFHQTTRELIETAGDAFSVTSALDVIRGNLEAHFEEQRRLVDELQDKLIRIRMVEFGSLAARLQRAVRVTCDEEGKAAQLTIENEKIKVDTQILDSLIEPLIHLLKNAVAHGIETPEVRRLLGKPETGFIEISLVNQETHIVLSVSDDGRGICSGALKSKAVALGLLTPEDAALLSEEDALELVFLPGLTTAEKLNLNAGRGVGMSIVKQSVESRKGSIAIESSPQRGTRFTLWMPLKLAVTRVLLVSASGQTVAVPLKQIKRICGPDERLVESSTETVVETLGGKVPAVALGDALTGRWLADDKSRSVFIIAENRGRDYAIGVDEVLRTEEVVIKPLMEPISNIRELLGAAIIGIGRLVPILDLPNFLKSKLDSKKKDIPEVKPNFVANDNLTVLIVDDSPSVRHMTKRVVESAGWRAVCAKDGLDALEQLKLVGRKPAVVLTDVEMPRMNGYELCSLLRRTNAYASIPVVMITSRSALKHQQRAKDCGASEYLTKPFNDNELIALIRELAKPI